MATVVDFAAGPPTGGQIKAAGHVGAVRYISPPRDGWMTGKPATRQQIDDMDANGLKTAFVWQFGKEHNSDVLRGRDGGVADARSAQEKLNELRCAGHPVFFAVDFDCTLDQWNRTVVEYFRGACEVLGKQRVGIYGHSRVVHWAMEDDVVATVAPGRVLGWQTKSWSQGEVAKDYAVLYQRAHNVTGPGGVQIDVNDVLHDQWGWQALPDAAPTQQIVMPGGPLNTGEQYRCDADNLTWRDNGRATKPRIAIILHTDESAWDPRAGAIRPTAWTADQLADYNKRRDIDGGSYHLGVDRTGRTVRQNDDVFGTWSVGNQGNDLCFHICMPGTAYQPRDMWLGFTKQLEKTAEVVAHYCLRYNIPARRATPAMLREGERSGIPQGIAGHWDCTWAWSGGSGHWDPGGYNGDLQNGTGRPTAGGFPWDVFIRMVQLRIDQRAVAPTPPTPVLPAPPPRKETPMVNPTETILTQLAGPDRDANGNPTYKGFDLDFLYRNAAAKGFKTLTTAEMQAVTIFEIRAQREEIQELAAAMKTMGDVQATILNKLGAK